jgi:hypothetical protein
MALVLALGILVVTSAMLIAIIDYTASNSRDAYVSGARGKSYVLAEAGVNNALSVIYSTSTPLYANLLPATTSSYDGGSVTWSGTLDTSSPNVGCPGHAACWVITATSDVRNPTSGSHPETKTLGIKVPVDPLYAQPLVDPAYDYVFVYGTGAPSGCDFSASNSSGFTSALYVQGNLCLLNSAEIDQELHVWGTVTVSSPQAGVGNSTTSDTKGVHVKGGCRYGTGAFHTPCSSTDHVWANPVDDASPRTLTAPATDWTGWYKAAQPGPYAPCQTSSGTPPSTGNWATVFDNDAGSAPDATKMNRSVTSVFNLTPSAAYSCKNAFGEISWNPSASPVPLLTVKGTVFIDGNARITPSSTPVVQYQGVGSVYVSGSVVIKGTNVCAKVSGSTCDWALPSSSHWDVANNFLDIVAGGVGGGGQSETADSTVDVVLSSSGYQGEVTAENRVDVSQQSSFQGPLVERSLTLGQALTTYPFGTLSYVPTATPGNPIKAANLSTPTGFSG